MNRIICRYKTSSRFFDGLQLLRHSSSSSTSTGSSVIKSKVDYFDSRADSWWDPSQKGSMNHLHLLDPYRIKFICDQLKSDPSLHLTDDENQPLRGLNILDVGCGVGILSEKLAMLGAEVTGIDPAERLVEAAKRRSSSTPTIGPQSKYLVSTAETHASSSREKYDAVLVLCLVEHIQTKPVFFNSCIQLLKPNGSLLIMACNRSLVTRFAFCFWNPYVLKLYPKNLLTYQLFYGTTSLLELLYAANCRLVDLRGLKFNWIGRGASFTTSNRYFNMIHVMKN